MKLSSKIDNNKLALIGLFGIMAYNAFPYIGAAAAAETETAEGGPSHKKRPNSLT